MKAFLQNKIKPHISDIVMVIILVPFYAVVGCPLRYFFGVCCPGCGMTRAALSILHLDFVAAFNYHPLVFVMPICVVIWFFRKHLSKRTKNILLGFGITLFFAVYLYRLFSGSPYIFIDPTRGFIYNVITSFVNK